MPHTNWKTCKSIIESNGVKNVIVTGAPFRLLYIAAELKSLGIHLIGDFRDPWTWSDVYGYGSLSDDRRATIGEHPCNRSS